MRKRSWPPPSLTLPLKGGGNPGLTRRNILILAAGAAAASALPASAQNAERHGMSAFGDLELPADFKHFGYVNPNAPKGGTFSEWVTSRTYNGSFLTFNSLNTYIL